MSVFAKAYLYFTYPIVFVPSSVFVLWAEPGVLVSGLVLVARD